MTYRCGYCAEPAPQVDELECRLATAERCDRDEDGCCSHCGTLLREDEAHPPGRCRDFMIAAHAHCGERIATAERELSECLSGQASLIDANAELGRQRDEARGKLALAVEHIAKIRSHCQPRLHMPAINWISEQCVDVIARIRGDK